MVEETDSKSHWENVYDTKEPNEVSWTQLIPKNSIDLIQSFKLPKDAKIIDIGGGDSLLVDHLLNLGYSHITVLDISSKAIEKAKFRLGELAQKVEWIVSDVLNFKPTEVYDIWHDRAAFHFLTEPNDVSQYIKLVSTIAKNVVMATFSDLGPLKCSGLPISQYKAIELQKLFESHFTPLQSFTQDHTTPFGTIQNFLYCSFKKS
jgi:SAM-dependent methyltransferase